MATFSNKYRLARYFLHLLKGSLAIIILTVISIPGQQAYAQDVILQNTTLNTTETITSSSAIIAGPNVTIGSSGEVTFTANRVAIIPKFVVVQGGRWQVVTGGMATGVETDGRQAIPSEFVVHQNFPNPFNPETKIRFALTRDSRVVIAIYNTLGQQIATLIDRQYTAGFHSVRWDGTNESGERASSGLYYYKITAGNFSVTKKMILMK